MRTIIYFYILLIPFIGFCQIEFNSPITLNENTYQHEFIDRTIYVTDNDITIITSIDSLKTDIQVLKITSHKIIKVPNGEDHVYYCTSVDNLYPTTLIFRKSNNIFLNIIVKQPSLIGIGVEEFNFLLK